MLYKNIYFILSYVQVDSVDLLWRIICSIESLIVKLEEDEMFVNQCTADVLKRLQYNRCPLECSVVTRVNQMQKQHVCKNEQPLPRSWNS